MKLISLEEVKTYLEKTDTEHDIILNLLIEGISKRFETFTGRKFKKGAYTEKATGEGWTTYQVQAYPIDESQPITVKREGSTLMKDSDFYLDPNRGVFIFTYQVYTRPLGMEFSYTGGYVEGTDGVLQVPEDLKQACLLQVAYEFLRRHELGATSINMPDGSIQIQPLSLLPEVKRILANYRRHAY